MRRKHPLLKPPQLRRNDHLRIEKKTQRHLALLKLFFYIDLNCGDLFQAATNRYSRYIFKNSQKLVCVRLSERINVLLIHKSCLGLKV